MDKNYIKLDFILGSTVETAVNVLLSYKEKGKLVYGVFNSVTLYSDTVTIDSAYKEITGMTKAQFDKHIGRNYNE